MTLGYCGRKRKQLVHSKGCVRTVRSISGDRLTGSAADYREKRPAGKWLLCPDGGYSHMVIWGLEGRGAPHITDDG